MKDIAEAACTALVSDISDALSPEDVDDFRKRLIEVPVTEGLSDRYWAVLRRLSWRTRGGVAPTLAQRVTDLQDQFSSQRASLVELRASHERFTTTKGE
jgi:hypothetical protein